MNIQESVTTCLTRKYADFSGRASRSEYWWFVLAQIIASIVLQILATYIFGLIGLLGLALIVPSLAVGARRLHDIGKSGWFLLLALVPIANFVLLYFLVQPSQPESNAYGAPPVA